MKTEEYVRLLQDTLRELTTEDYVRILRDALKTHQYDIAISEAKNFKPIDIAEALAQLDTAADAWTFLRHLPDRSEIFAFFDAEQQVRLADTAPRGGLAPIVGEMPADARADLFKRLDKDQQTALLPALAQAKRDDLRKLVSYREGTAGALMTSDYAALSFDMSVADALVALRQEAPDAETIYHAFVLDEELKLIGVISLRDLILASPMTAIKDLMVSNVIYADVMTTQEEIAKLIARYDLIALPITDEAGRLVGIVTHDDAMDAASEEATEDIHKGAGVTTHIGNIKDASIRVLYQKRVFWLVLLVFGNILSGMGIAHFEEIIASNIVLVFFLPLLVDSGGNAGSQSSTLMVRALATGEVLMKDWFKLIAREGLVAIALGFTMAFAVSFIGWYRGGPEIALVVSLSMIFIVLIGCLIGMSLPFLLNQFRMDPASASGPLITSICDASGVIIYLYIASQFLTLTV